MYFILFQTLITIFEYLLPPDRRIASQVCKRFLEIWLRDKFIYDRYLKFSECLLDPKREPYTVLLKSQRIYKFIWFHEIKIPPGKKLEKLWRKLGEHVTKIQVSSCNVPDEAFWKMFPELEHLVLDGAIDGHYFDVLPHSLKKISLYCISPVEELLTTLDEKYLMRRSSDVILDFDRIDNYSLSIDFIRKYSNNIESLKIYGSELLEFPDTKFSSLKTLILELEDVDEGEQRKILDNLEEKFPKLATLDLRLANNLPHKDWKYLEHIEIIDPSSVEISRLGQFKNVESFCVESETRCFFTHEPILNKKIKDVQIFSVRNVNLCLECFKTMTESLPNLETLHSASFNTSTHMAILAINSPKLNIFSVNQMLSYDRLSFGNFTNLVQLHLNGSIAPSFSSWPVMPFLRTLIMNMEQLNDTNVGIFKNMPALDYLRLTLDFIHGDANNLICQIVMPLKLLQNLKVSSKATIYMDLETIEEIVSNRKYLKYIKLTPFHEMNSIDVDEEMRKIFEKYSWVRVISLDDHYTIVNIPEKTSSLSNVVSTFASIFLVTAVVTVIGIKGLPKNL